LVTMAIRLSDNFAAEYYKQRLMQYLRPTHPTLTPPTAPGTTRIGFLIQSAARCDSPGARYQRQPALLERTVEVTECKLLPI
ncbi:MAG TPA: hypothetical protein PK201_16580, partial [Accumulibacter sp.]|nr:hypothetical protein [Accumulibacter sp.]